MTKRKGLSIFLTQKMAPSTLVQILATIIIIVSALTTLGRCQADEPLRKLISTKELDQARDQLMRHPWALLYYNDADSPTSVSEMIYDSKILQNVTYLSPCENFGYNRMTLRALNTFGTCVRVFQLSDCQGSSIAIYPNEIETIRTYTALPSEPHYPTPGYVAIGPCLENEFETATFFRSSKNQLLVRKDVRGSRLIPDLINITPMIEVGDVEYLIDNWRLYFCDDYPSSPFFIRGNYPFDVCFKNLNGSRRVEKIETLMTPESIRPGQESSSSSSSSSAANPGLALVQAAWDSMDKEEGDVMGFIIPPTLTEFPYVASNVFPTSAESRERWERVLEEIPRSFKSQPEYVLVEAMLQVRFYYRDSVETRPYGFYYWIHLNNRRIKYGFHWV